MWVDVNFVVVIIREEIEHVEEVSVTWVVLYFLVIFFVGDRVDLIFCVFV